MNFQKLGLVSTFLGSVSVAGVARADVPPPNDYVETCTIADRQTAGAECLVCLSTRGRDDRCEPLLVPYCFVKVCHVWSGSSEVWCRTQGAGVPAVPSETLDALRPVGYPLPPAIDGGAAAAPSSCLPYTPSAAGGQTAATGGSTGSTSSDSTASDKSSGCTVGGWLSAKAFMPWLTAGLFAGLFTLLRRRRR